MPLDPNRFTRKTQEALGAAQTRARESGNTEVSTAHLLRALLDQPEGVVSGVIELVPRTSVASPRGLDVTPRSRFPWRGSPNCAWPEVIL